MLPALELLDGREPEQITECEIAEVFQKINLQLAVRIDVHPCGPEMPDPAVELTALFAGHGLMETASPRTPSCSRSSRPLSGSGIRYAAEPDVS